MFYPRSTNNVSTALPATKKRHKTPNLAQNTPILNPIASSLRQGTKSKTYHHAIDHAPVISNQQGKLLDPQVFKGSPKENWSIKTSNELNHLKRGVVTYPERTDSSAVESASSQASANSGETHICQIHNETLDQCLDQEGTYVCKSYGSRCFIIQKMPSSIRTTNGQPIDTQSIQQTLNVAEIKSLVSEATIVVNSNLITWKSKADVCSFARTNATKYPNLDSRNCQECLASSLASSLAKLKASKDQENQTVTSTSNQNIYVQQVRIDKAAASTISSTANETSSFNNPGSRLCTSTTQLYRTQVCSTILSSSSSPSSRSIEPVLLDSSKRGNSNCANNASKYFTALSYKPSSKKKQKFLGRPITPQFEISSKANNNLSSSIGYKSTATYPLKKWPLINSKENGVTSTDDVPGGTTTITVTPPTPLTKESFIVPNGISINGAFTSRTKSLISSVVSTGSKPIDNSGLFSRPGNEFILAQAKKRFQSKIYRSQSLGNLVPNSSKKNPKDLRQQKEVRDTAPLPSSIDATLFTCSSVSKPRSLLNSKVPVIGLKSHQLNLAPTTNIECNIPLNNNIHRGKYQLIHFNKKQGVLIFLNVENGIQFAVQCELDGRGHTR
ncbi:uncharacterized protein LOC131884866 [Tigriopus californicus]|uniref:uncharacterized protein LOC131884866 n=1 Tax=Tigriopus californicus TaxID=6832 RepID=UPI0027DA3592|nr:uncharacterized protein LOC131884866 [Tigriopus californicus]